MCNKRHPVGDAPVIQCATIAPVCHRNSNSPVISHESVFSVLTDVAVRSIQLSLRDLGINTETASLTNALNNWPLNEQKPHDFGDLGP